MVPKHQPSPLTERGEARATDVVPIAFAIRFPGTEIGSGDIDKVFMTAGSSGAPQFFHAKPSSCQTGHIHFLKNCETQAKHFHDCKLGDLPLLVSAV